MSSASIGIYIGGPGFPDYTKVPLFDLDQLIANTSGAGFGRVLLWSLFFELENDNFVDGDITFNDLPVTSGSGGNGKSTYPIVTGGAYVGPASWPSDLTALKDAGLDSIYFSTLGTFGKIQSLIQEYGTGSDNPLSANLQALRTAFPAVTGVDLDDEDLWDVGTIVAFSKMLDTAGFAVSFCPYNNTDTWAQAYSELESYKSGLVTGFNCQFYGSASASDYIKSLHKYMGTSFDAAGILSGGYYCRHQTKDGWLGMCPSTVQSTIAELSPLGLQGGWMYIYESIVNSTGSDQCGGAAMDAAAYATALSNGLDRTS